MIQAKFSLKESVADCLQTRPVDRRARLVKVQGELEDADMEKIDDALKIVFDLARGLKS